MDETLILTTRAGGMTYTNNGIIKELFNILNSTRLARLIAFEIWRDLVMARKPDESKLNQWEGTSFMCSKRTVLAILNEFIDELRS